eukprot:7104050-Heterocapsa_arctica.AAC.1
MLGRPWPVVLRAKVAEEGLAPEVAEMADEREPSQTEGQDPHPAEEGDWPLEEQFGFFGKF